MIQTPANAGKAALPPCDHDNRPLTQCTKSVEDAYDELFHSTHPVEGRRANCVAILENLIERDRTEREGRIKYMESLKEAMRTLLAEQSAALAASNDALNLAMQMGPGCSTGFIGSVQTKARDALAQIAALAARKKLMPNRSIKSFHKCTVSRRLKDGTLRIKCRLGLWAVEGKDHAQAQREAMHYWMQYFEDGEYSIFTTATPK